VCMCVCVCVACLNQSEGLRKNEKTPGKRDLCEKSVNWRRGPYVYLVVNLIIVIVVVVIVVVVRRRRRRRLNGCGNGSRCTDRHVRTRDRQHKNSFAER